MSNAALYASWMRRADRPAPRQVRPARPTGANGVRALLLRLFHTPQRVVPDLPYGVRPTAATDHG